MISLRNSQTGTGAAKAPGIGATMFLLLVCLMNGGCSKSQPADAERRTVFDPNVLNRLLQAYIDLGEQGPLTREDFNDPELFTSFLHTLVSVYYTRGPIMVPSSCTLRAINSARFMDNNSLTDTAFHELFKDPVFVFDGDRWRVEFNLLAPDGSLDRWTIEGNHDRETSSVLILMAERIQVKPERSFKW